LGLTNNGINRRRFIQGGIIAGIGFMLGMARPVRANTNSPSSSSTLDWTLKQLNRVHYLRVQTNASVDRIEWRHLVRGVSDAKHWHTVAVRPRQTEFLLGNLTGRIELRTYHAQQLVRRELIQINELSLSDG
jgi:hypothetical protein